MFGCWHGYLYGATCRLAYGPADATATHCRLLQIGFTFWYGLTRVVLDKELLNGCARVFLCLVAAVVSDAAVHSSTSDVSPSSTTRPQSSGLRQQEAGALLSNTPVGVYRHQLRAVREKLRLETARCLQYEVDVQLARDQLAAETHARTAIQVTVVQVC